MGFNELIDHLKRSGELAVDAILDALRLPDVVRQGVGNVLLAGISTNAAAVAAARVRFAIRVARRQPFASPQSICAAAFNAATEADKYVPYVITVEAFFGDPVAMLVLGGFTGVPGVGPDVAAIAKAKAILVLLAAPLDLKSIDDLVQIFTTLVTDLDNRAGQLYTAVGKQLDPSDFVSGKPLDQSTRGKLDALTISLDRFQAPSLDGLWAGVPKVFNAAVRGTERITDAILAQYAALCGAGSQPARAFYERRDHTISLDRTYPSIPAGDGSWALLVSRTHSDLFAVEATDEQSRSEFGLSGKTTELTLDAAKKDELRKHFCHKVRELTVFAESEEVRIAEKPLNTFVEGTLVPLEQLTRGLLSNRPIAVSGRLAYTEESVAEVVFLELASTVVENQKSRTQLTLKQPLAHKYLRDTVQVNANVAPASHGESLREVLGSGDASARHQKFALKQPPLTYVAAPTVSGCAPTLDVFVNDMRWKEVETLVAREPHERVFVTEADDEGRTTVRFGDGVEGAVAASGFNNIRAEYRKGIGEPGNVDAGKLTTLLVAPLGVASVNNPIEASGGENSEPIDDIRSNAPMKVRTFERAVSLTDYEEFAVIYPGIAKTLATWTPAGAARGILLTVAGLHGEPVADTSDAHRNLFTALRTFGDPLIPLEIKTYRPATFRVKATVTLAADVTPETVMDQVAVALRRDFGFDARPFADAVSIDDVMASIHTVSGVVAVDVDAFYRDGQPVQLNATLVALPPELQSDGSMAPAELLCLNEAPIDLTSVQLEGVA
jgi:predicted phage baseplate assembly protein